LMCARLDNLRSVFSYQKPLGSYNMFPKILADGGDDSVGFCMRLLKEAKVTCANQAWVSDITYIETADGFAYLALVSDLFSRRIMGFDVSQSLSVEGSMRALLRAIRQAQGKVTNLIHHSDRGIQYTCHAYRQRLERFQIRSSMGETGNCYDNAVAERINGILKLQTYSFYIFSPQS